MTTAQIIFAAIYSIGLLWTGYEYGKGVGHVRGNVEGRKAIRKQFEQVGR